MVFPFHFHDQHFKTGAVDRKEADRSACRPHKQQHTLTAMSPNNKQNLSKDLENEIQNANLNQFAGQHFSSEEDDDRVITNGYMLLSHDLEQANGEDDSSSDFESDSSDEEIPADQLNQMVRCSVNVDFQEEPQNDEEEDRPEDAGRELENDRSASSRFRSYLDGQLQDVPFEREFDKHETNTEQQNTISLDKGELISFACNL